MNKKLYNFLLKSYNNLFLIKTSGLFVQNQQRWRTEQRLSQPYALLVALGKIAYKPSRYILDMGQTTGLLDAFLTSTLQPLDAKDKAEIFFHGHLRVKRRLLGEITDFFLGGQRSLHHVCAVYQDTAFISAKISGQHIHRGRFSGAVRPQKSQYIPLFYREADMFYNRFFSIAFCQPFDRKHAFPSPKKPRRRQAFT